MKRRTFLGSVMAGAGSMLFADKAAQAAPDEAATALVPLGKSLKVCRLGAGTGMRGGNRQTNQTRMGKEKFEALLQYEYDQGIRLFDCADMYGTHPYVGRIMKGKPRESFQVVSKLWLNRGGLPEPERPGADVSVKRFLQELQMEYIDIVQIHCMFSPKWPTEMRKQMDIMEKLKEQGLIKAHGVSCHTLAALKAAAAEPWVDVIHARINPFNLVMDGPKEDVLPVLKQAHEAGKGIIGMKIVGEGKITPEQLPESIKFALSSGVVDAMVAGFESKEEVDRFKALLVEALAASKK